MSKLDRDQRLATRLRRARQSLSYADRNKVDSLLAWYGHAREFSALQRMAAAEILKTVPHG